MYRQAPVLDGLVFSGVVVEARDPKELVMNTEMGTRCTEPGLDGGARVTQARSHGYPVSA